MHPFSHNWVFYIQALAGIMTVWYTHGVFTVAVSTRSQYPTQSQYLGIKPTSPFNISNRYKLCQSLV